MAASKPMLLFLVLVVFLCLLLIKSSEYCINSSEEYGCFNYGGDDSELVNSQTRKLLGDLIMKKKNKEATHYQQSMKNTKTIKTTAAVGWELRRVPSGPDPLHHFGHTPNKPRTDP